MGAPKGNKNGVGHGRPPRVGFSNEEIIVLGKELLDWCKRCDVDKTEVVHLSEWYSEIKEISYSYWRELGQRIEFAPYYERAMLWMGKRILKNKKLAQSYGNRFLGIYFKEIREMEWENKKREIDYETDKRNAQNVDPALVEKFMAVMDTFSKAQSSALNTQETSINAESKS